MQKGISIVDLAQKIETNRTLKKDFIASTNTLEMEVVDNKPLLNVHGQGRFPIMPVAHDQIGGRVGIPGKYYDRMLNEDPKLLATNVNTWFWKNPEKRMVRTLANNNRAFLSNRYNRIEHEDIAEVALPILHKIPEVQIPSCELTERRLYIQAVSPRVQGAVKLNDVVQAGVIISNSETGQGAVSISPMVYRLRCLNGMVLPDQKFRAYHVGRKVEDNAELWRDDTRLADDRAVLLKVRDMVEAAVSDAYFKKQLEKMTGLAEGKITGKVQDSVEVLAQKINVSETEKENILDSLIKAGDFTAWGLLNAVTAQAHTAPTYDRAVEFETVGGGLLELNKSEWTEILQAA